MPDLFCLAFIAVALLFDHFVVWAAFLRRSKTDSGRARLTWYRALVAELWAQAACVALLWLRLRRSPALLGLKASVGWQLWASVAVVSGFTLLLAGATIRLARLVRRKHVKLQSHAALRSPHSIAELLWWAAVSLSAGFCEELIFRGFLIWLFQPLLGWWGSAGLSLVAFAAAHAYEGITGVIAVAAVGALLTLVVFVCGSLWAAIAIHVLLDIQQGLAAWLVLRNSDRTNVVAVPA